MPFLTTLKSTTIVRENIRPMVTKHQLNMRWSGGTKEKRLDLDATFLWQNHIVNHMY